MTIEKWIVKLIPATVIVICMIWRLGSCQPEYIVDGGLVLTAVIVSFGLTLWGHFV